MKRSLFTYFGNRNNVGICHKQQTAVFKVWNAHLTPFVYNFNAFHALIEGCSFVRTVEAKYDGTKTL